MKTIAVIPARYGSSRFPGKPLAKICEKPMIQWVYENTSKNKKISEVYVATDDERIFNVVTSFGGKAMMTSSNHTCGTDRIAECAQKLCLSDDDIIVNVQGDEPLVKAEMISDLLSAFVDESVYMATLVKHLKNNIEASNPNIVKVVFNTDMNALYFSRAAIPFSRNVSSSQIYIHIGMYAYKNYFLQEFTQMKKTSAEKAEMLEQLRVLEHGFKIRCMETAFQTVSVDTPDDIKKVENCMVKKESFGIMANSRGGVQNIR